MVRTPRDAAHDYATSLVGRQQILSTLSARLEPPFKRSLAIFVEGPAGIGKTALLRAALSGADAAGVSILRASPLEGEVTFAYSTLRDLLSVQVAVPDSRIPPIQLATLSAALGESGRDEGTLNGQQVAFAVLAALRAIAAARPTVIAIDDANWVDAASREALTFALRRLTDQPVRVLLTQRSEAPAGPLPLGVGSAVWPLEIERIWLEPLSLGALQAVLQNATGSTYPRPTLLRIHEISAGNPFYAIELARAIAGRGALLRPGEDLPVPSSLRELVAERLTAQTPESRRLLLTAALSSRPTIDQLAVRAGSDPVPILTDAIDAGLLRFDGPVVAFAHPLFASTLVAESSEADKRDGHAWLGEAEEDVEARARHLALATAGVDHEVAGNLAAAASQARARGAPAVAAELADLSVERTPASDPQRVERSLFAADCWYEAGALDTVRRRVAQILPGVSGTSRARALMLDGLAAWYLASAREAVVRMSQALADAGDDHALAGLLSYYMSVMRNFDIEGGRRDAMAAADLLESTDDRGHLGAALMQRFYLSVLTGRGADLDVLERGLAAEQDGPLTDRLTSPGIWWAGIGRLDLARERFQNILDFDRAYGMYSNGGNVLTRLAEVEMWADDWPLARRLATEAIDADLANGAAAEEMAMRTVAMIDALEGHTEEAMSAASAGCERMERSDAQVLMAAWLGVIALVHASRGNHAAVVAATERADRSLQHVGMREPMRLDPAPEWIEALAELGRLEEAEGKLDALAERHRQVPKPWASAAISRGRARLAMARDDLPAALAATDVAAGTEPERWSRFDLARVLLVRGEALRRARSRRAAGEVLTRARDMFAALGASVWAQRAADELARLGLTRTTSLALTPTERRVARLAGSGLSTKEVAAQLGISPRTVETHLAAVYGKLGVSSRAELGRFTATSDES
jgi:DNA-binding CsgD family transcriptional regulator